AAFPPPTEGEEGMFTVTNAVDVGVMDPLAKREVLLEYLDRAVSAVGGWERAQFLLDNPGLTIDVDPALVRPARQEWIKASERANALIQQSSIALTTFFGGRIIEDIAGGRAEWEDVVYGYLGRDQIERRKGKVAELHRAFRGEPAMPLGHTDPKASFTIPD